MARCQQILICFWSGSQSLGVRHQPGRRSRHNLSPATAHRKSQPGNRNVVDLYQVATLELNDSLKFLQPGHIKDMKAPLNWEKKHDLIHAPKLSLTCVFFVVLNFSFAIDVCQKNAGWSLQGCHGLAFFGVRLFDIWAEVKRNQACYIFFWFWNHLLSINLSKRIDIGRPGHYHDQITKLKAAIRQKSGPRVVKVGMAAIAKISHAELAVTCLILTCITCGDRQKWKISVRFWCQEKPQPKDNKEEEEEKQKDNQAPRPIIL